MVIPELSRLHKGYATKTGKAKAAKISLDKRPRRGGFHGEEGVGAIRARERRRETALVKGGAEGVRPNSCWQPIVINNSIVFNLFMRR